MVCEKKKCLDANRVEPKPVRSYNLDLDTHIDSVLILNFLTPFGMA